MKVTEVERKESTKHCCGNGWTQKNRAEHEGYAGALIGKRIAENNTTNADRGVNGLLERIVEAGNLNRAYKRVRRNKGAGGVDGMKVDPPGMSDVRPARFSPDGRRCLFLRFWVGRWVSAPVLCPATASVREEARRTHFGNAGSIWKRAMCGRWIWTWRSSLTQSIKAS